MMRFTSLARDDGFTVVEMMIAALLLVVGVLGSVALVDGANATTLSTRAREGATNLAREVVEDARSVEYADVAPGTIEQRLRAKPGLDANPSSSTWTVERRGFTYTVTATACTVDDAKDGAGPHDTTASFCSGSAAAGTLDDDPEDYKRVTVVVSWGHRSRTRQVRQTGMVPNPGGADGVTIEQLSGPTNVPGSDPVDVDYSVTTDRDAETVEWFVNGVHMGEATGSGQDWQFTWTTEGCEGVHYVTAHAYDRFGRSAGPRTLTVKTNGAASCSAGSGTTPPPSGGTNHPPTAPGTLTFSVAGSKVKLDWGAATDPDAGDSIAEYRVYRDGTLLTSVGGRSYTDSSTGGSPHSYYVRAVDNHGAEGPQSNTVNYSPKGYTP